MEPPWGRGRGRGWGRSSPQFKGRASPSGSSYGSSSNSPVIQMGKRSLVNERISLREEASIGSSVHLEDIPEDSPLYAHLQAYLAAQKQKDTSVKQGDTFASISKDDNDDIKSYEKVSKQEMIFLLENSDLQRKDEPWKIFQRYLINGLYYPGESYKTRSYYETILISTGSADFQHFSGYSTDENVYNFSKIIIKQIISVEDWGISTMKERQISLNKNKMNFTYWDYIQAFEKVLYYNNDRHKHTWFIKVCAKIFTSAIPNWFLDWWSYHGPTIKILPDPFLMLYKEWIKVSPFLNDLYQADHICYPEKINQIYFFLEFSIPWIHKWNPEVGFTEEQIPCLYRTFYNNFWDKLMKIDPKTKTLYGQELLDLIEAKIQEYSSTPQKKIIDDSSVRHIARKISFQEGDKTEMINEYLEEVKRNLLLSINQYEKSDTSMQSETSHDDNAEDSQPIETERIMSEEDLDDAEEFIRKMKKAEKKLAQ